MHITLRHLAAAIGLAASAPLWAQALPPSTDAPYEGVIALDVDATDLDRKIFRVRQALPVKPGPLVLYYPRWLPGSHSPSAVVSKLAGLRISVQGLMLDWQRNTLDTHAFHVEVPAGASSLEIEFEFLSALDKGSGRVVVTPEMLGLQWHSVLLYPAGHAAANITVKPRLTLPAGWGFGSALTATGREGATVSFAPVSVETLVDSPVFAGQHHQQLDLDPGAVAAGRAPVYLQLARRGRIRAPAGARSSISRAASSAWSRSVPAATCGPRCMASTTWCANSTGCSRTTGRPSCVSGSTRTSPAHRWPASPRPAGSSPGASSPATTSRPSRPMARTPTSASPSG
jgi:hypothetical protein